MFDVPLERCSPGCGRCPARKFTFEGEIVVRLEAGPGCARRQHQVASRSTERHAASARAVDAGTAIDRPVHPSHPVPVRPAALGSDP